MIRITEPTITLAIYVDDIICTCKNLKTLLDFAETLKADFPVTVEPITQILGLEVNYQMNYRESYLYHRNLPSNNYYKNIK